MHTANEHVKDPSRHPFRSKSAAAPASTVVHAVAARKHLLHRKRAYRSYIIDGRLGSLMLACRHVRVVCGSRLASRAAAVPEELHCRLQSPSRAEVLPEVGDALERDLVAVVVAVRAVVRRADGGQQVGAVDHYVRVVVARVP